VNDEIASLLLDNFGTVVGIFTARKSDLIKLEGIDDEIIEKIIQKSK
jgi:ERCC4-type nuclease